MKNVKKLLCVVCSCLGMVTASHAAIVSTSGSMTYVTAPGSVAAGATENTTSIITFDEQQNYTLSTDLSLDYLSSTENTGSLAAGREINSYFVHFDAVGAASQVEDLVTITGSVTFDKKILGIIWSGLAHPNAPATPQYLDASDYLGATGTFYATGELGRGLELDSDPYYTGRGDIFTVSADGRTVDVSMTSYPLRVDQFRVITSVVPVPAAVYLFFSGIISLGLLGRKKRQAIV